MSPFYWSELRSLFPSACLSWYLSKNLLVILLSSSSCSPLPPYLSLVFIFIFFHLLEGFLCKGLFGKAFYFWHLINFYCSLSSPLMIVSLLNTYKWDTSRQTDILLQNIDDYALKKTLGKWVKFSAYFFVRSQTQNAVNCMILTM